MIKQQKKKIKKKQAEPHPERRHRQSTHLFLWPLSQ